MNSKIKIFCILFIILVVILGVIYMCKNIKQNKEYDFKVYFFKAGKADSILISNNDKYILIDTGEADLADDILTYFRNNNITKLDYLIITHFDKDHVGSASEIINSIEIDNILQSNSPKESEYYNNYIEALENKSITPNTVSGDLEFTLGDFNVVVNGPDKTYDSNESNNSSLIVSINYKDTNYLFMGDSQNDRIKDYLSEHSDKKYDFIKIPYHGHFQKQLDNLLEAVNPKYAVITCSNSEMEDDETVNLLKQLNIKYYVTRQGSITIKSDGKDIVIEQ